MPITADLPTPIFDAQRLIYLPNQPVIARTVERSDQLISVGPNTRLFLPAPGSNASPIVFVGEPQLAAAIAPAVNIDVPRAIVDEAERHIGYREGRGNRNKFSTYFHRPPEAWCADFVSYVYETTGHPIGREGVGFASVRQMADWFSSQGYLYAGPPQAGDTIFFKNSRKGRWNHVGIVERVSNGTVHTIEGNVGRNGGVARRAYAITNPNILGYGRIPAAMMPPPSDVSLS